MATLLEIGLTNAAVATALALVAAVVGRVGRRPALTHALWLLVLLKLITPPLWVVHLPWPAAPEAEAVAAPDAVPGPTAEEELAAASAPAPVTESDVSPAAETAPWEPVPDVAAPVTVPARVAVPGPTPAPLTKGVAAPPTSAFPWQTWAVAAWLAGALSWWALAAVRLGRFRRSLRHARPAPDEVRAQAELLAARLALWRCPRVEMLPAAVSPMLWAVAGAPRLLLPAPLWRRLSPAQQETLLVHELAHLRHGDHWVRRLELLVLGLYWWHPVVWWARSAVQEAEEQCCDACVVRTLPHRAADYAAALLETVVFLSPPRTALPVGASGAGSARLLKRRLSMILHARTARPLPWYTRAALLGAAAVLLPILPARAQSVTPPAVAPANTSPPTSGDTVSAPPATGETTAPATSTDRTESVADGALVGAARAEDADDLKDAVELLQARLASKRAELKEAQALRERARRDVDRLEKLNRQGTVSEGEIDRARTDLTVHEARVAGKAAQLQELEVQLRQARRRLARTTGARTTSASVAANGLPAVARTSTALEVPTPRVTTAPSTSAPPVVGTTTAVDTRPAITGRMSTAGRDQEQRLRDVERKLDTLLREINALRRELHQQRQDAPPRGPSRSVPEEQGAPVGR